MRLPDAFKRFNLGTRAGRAGRIAWFASLLFCPLTPVLADDDSPADITVSGTVWVKGVRSVIANADIFVINNDELYTQSDDQGHFTLHLPAPGVYALAATAYGYTNTRPQILTLAAQSAGATLDFYLLPSRLLPDVVVNGERNPDRVGKTVVSGKELEQVAGSNGDPLRAVQSLPGVAVANDASAAPAIRGTRPGDNSYVADDMPIGYLFHSGGFSSVFHADLINDFNIYGGAFSPEHLDVIGAVLDVSLREPRTDRFGSKWNISFIGSDVLLEGPVNADQSFYLAGRRSYFDLLVNEISNKKEGITFQLPRYWDYQGKYVWRLSAASTLRLHASGARDSFSFSVADDSKIADEQPVLVGDSSFATDYHQQAVSLETRLDETRRNKLILGHMRTSQDMVLGTAGSIDVSQDNYFIREKYWFPLTAGHDLLLGADVWQVQANIDLAFRNARCTGEFETDCDLSTAESASLRDDLWINGQYAYAKDRWHFADRWTLVPGLRLSRDDYLHDTYLEPRLGLEWDYSDNTLLTLGWGRHHQYPSGNYIIDVFGNPQLRQVEAEHLVAGIARQLDAGWNWKLDTYYKDMRNYVTADPNVNYVNGATGWAYGAELLVKKTQTEALSGWLSLTYSRSLRRITATGQRFPFEYDQPWIAVTNFTYRFTPVLSLSAKWNYHTGQPYTPIYGSNGTYSDGRPRPNYGQLNSRRLPNYHRLDLRLDYDHPYNTWKLNTYFELINAYAHNNVAGYDYNADYTDRDPVYQLPLIPSFGVQADF